MRKFLYFANSTSDAVMFPAENLFSMEIDSDSTAIDMVFRDGLGQSNTITVGTGDANQAAVVIKAIAEEIRVGKEVFIVVADEVNSEFLHANIDAVDTSALVL